ncbi:TSUP family transporter [Deltaproteobacteria bacterium TL4]
MAVFLSITGIALFMWGVHILREHSEYNAFNYVDSTEPKAISIKAEMPPQPAFSSNFEKTVVSVAGELENQFIPVGSGVVVSESGHIVTALHLISNFKILRVEIHHQFYDAQVIKKIYDHDLVLLKVISNDIFPYTRLECPLPDRGETVYAFGIDNGLIARQGIINGVGLNLNINQTTYRNLLKTDAIYTWTQSGGPLMNIYGHMIGLNIAVNEPTGFTGYAVPSLEVCTGFRDMVDFDVLKNLDLYTEEIQAKWIQRAKDFAESVQEVIVSNKLEQIDLYAEDYSKQGWEQARSLANKMVEVYNKAEGIDYTLKILTEPDLYIWGHTINSIFGLLLLGFISGVSAGMVTMGGGIIKISGLMLIFGYGLSVIRPVAYITNIFVYGAAAIRYKKDKLISWGNVTPLIPFAIVGFLIGYFTGNYLDNTTIRYMLGVFAAWIGFKMVLEIYQSLSGRSVAEPEPTPEGEGHHLKNSWLGLPMGIISGILGISGGVIEVPLQRYFAKVPLKEAIANSSVLVFWTSFLGAIVAMVHGGYIGAFDVHTPIILAVIVIPGAYFGGMAGAWLTKNIPLNALRTIYALLMFLIAARMLVSYV